MESMKFRGTLAVMSLMLVLAGCSGKEQTREKTISNAPESQTTKDKDEITRQEGQKETGNKNTDDKNLGNVQNSDEINLEDLDLYGELYAADNNASNLEGYKKLLSQYSELQDGKEVEITYDFECPEYQTLLDTYNIKKIAGEGSEFERAVRLMDYFAPRLTHESNYDNHVEENALALLEYSLGNPSQGINCLAKSKVLNEMCLALGIYARRVFLIPYSSVDMDSHVVSEIYDTNYKKWIMIDMTTDGYFINKEEIPLSALEIRECAAKGELCTYIYNGFKGTPELAARQFEDNNSYIMKNMFIIGCQNYNGFGNKDGRSIFYIIPKEYDLWKREVSNDKYRLKYAIENKMDTAWIEDMAQSLQKLEGNQNFNQDYAMSANVLKQNPMNK